MNFTDIASFFFVMKSHTGTRKKHTNQLLAYQPVTALEQRRDCQKNLNVNKINGQRSEFTIRKQGDSKYDVYKNSPPGCDLRLPSKDFFYQVTFPHV